MSSTPDNSAYAEFFITEAKKHRAKAQTLPYRSLARREFTGMAIGLERAAWVMKHCRCANAASI